MIIVCVSFLCVFVFLFVYCICFMKEGMDWILGYGFLRIVEWFIRRYGEWVKFYYVNLFDFCKYLYWYRYIKKKIWKNYILKIEMFLVVCVLKISYCNVFMYVNKMIWNYLYINKMCWLIFFVLVYLDSIICLM